MRVIKMIKALRIFLLVAVLSGCANKYSVLLVGTLHSTPIERRQEVRVVKEAVQFFHPNVLCAEYVLPDDSASVFYRFGNHAYQDMATKSAQWNVDSNHNAAIRALTLQLEKKPDDVSAQFKLMQHYFLSLNRVNAEYQGYLLFSASNFSNDDSMMAGSFHGYAEAKCIYEFAAVAGSEYDPLVFPLAKALNISYVYPIDDLGTWTEYEKYFDALQSIDSAQQSEVAFDSLRNSLRNCVDGLDNDSSKWLFSNSTAIQQRLLAVEGYHIPQNASSRMKGLNYYWVLRNRAMAKHIYDVVRKHPRERVAVFFGASHVGAVKAELERINKRIRVVTLPNLIP